MINVSDITKAIETLLNDNLNGYVIERNARRNADPNIAAQGAGWIGIYRGAIKYEAHTTGARPWLASPRPKVEIQAASMISGADAEDRLQAAEKEVLDVLNSDLTLGGTVLHTTGYEIEYEYNEEEEIWHHASLIDILTEVRA